jgi:hypothetical protein
MVTQKREAELTAEERRQRQIELNKEAIRLLDSWLEDDSETPEEQRIALEQVMRGIDAEREGGRQLFQRYLNAPNDSSR